MAGGVAPGAGSENATHDGKNYTGPLIIVTLLFFMWGFITCLNDIIMPKLQSVFALNNVETALVQFCFFGAYFIISLLYFIVSVSGSDPIQKIGYKKTIVIGLIVSGIGCLLFYPASEIESFPIFLGALFVLASGITILQMGANPYVALLGKPETSSGRLNMTQAFNSLGTTVAPLMGIIIFSGGETDHSSHSVEMPYILLACTLGALALLISRAKLPAVTTGNGEKVVGSALKYRHLALGVLCIFMYVGGEVSIGSFLVKYLGLENIAGFNESQASPYLSLFWGGAMVGRFYGAVFMSKMSKNNTTLYIIGIVVFSFLLGLFFTDVDITLSAVFSGLALLNLLAFFIGKNNPNTTLGLFGFAVMVLLLLGVTMDGQFAMWSIISIGLFNSIMFPTIFTLAIKGLGNHTSQGASLLVMAIVGGALIPLIHGFVADVLAFDPSTGLGHKNNFQLAYVVPMFCYLYIAYYGFIGSKPKEGQLQATS